MKRLSQEELKYKGKSGIYRIFNIKNHKSYIGSAVNLHHRKTVHFRFLRKGLHHSIILQRAFNKYGEEVFRFEVLEECQKDLLINREQFYMDLYKPQYNIQKVAGSSLGRPCNEETRQKISKKNKGKKMSEETCKKMSESRKGIPPSQNCRDKAKEARKILIVSEETRRKIGDASRRRKPDSPETTLKKSIAAALRNKRPILQFDKNGVFIQEWPSIKECEEALGITNVIRILKYGYLGKRGFSFKYKSDVYG